MSTTDCKKVKRPKPSQEEEEEKKRYEEFWSDPCWTEPLDQPE